ncbi:MAG: potassium channel family protein [Pirellulales bacterium]
MTGSREYRAAHAWKFRLLLTALVAMLTIQPVVGRHDVSRLSYTTLWTIVLVATLFAISEVRWQRRIGLCLGLPFLAGMWGRHLVAGTARETFELPVFGLAAVFVVLVAVTVMRHLVTHDVTADNVAGAVCAYLFIGLGIGMVFTMIESLEPHSFVASAGELADEIAAPARRPSALTYFSFVTLTTAGYGDIVPATPLTRILAALEAVLGQFYLAVLVAGLVGIRISRRSDGGAGNN